MIYRFNKSVCGSYVKNNTFTILSKEKTTLNKLFIIL